MIEKDVLFTLAELAVALAGFSAIIGVLGTRKDSSHIKVNALRLQVMLETMLHGVNCRSDPCLAGSIQSDTWSPVAGRECRVPLHGDSFRVYCSKTDQGYARHDLK